ncbi:MAG: hypothetical protein WCH43_04725 [Verrucomicrobiota bacterium]
MFKRIVCEDWTIVMPVTAFFFTAAVFIYTSIRALKLSKARREELANLPLDD